MSIPQTAYWHALNLLTHGNAWKLTTASHRLGGPGKIFESTEQDLLDAGLTPKQAQYLYQKCSDYPVMRQYQAVLSDGTQIIINGTNQYPDKLSQTHDAPPILYVKGDARLLNRDMLAVVGSRHMTSYGREVINTLVPTLTQAGLHVISGLAHGVDAAALDTCLQFDGQPVAVLATSLADGEISPRTNARLAKQIIAQGCLVSETPPGCRPAKNRFPLRNRIVSGLSRGIVVIEAALRSGSLITARLGLEQNREIFAVPGPIFAPFSQGTLWLIQQGAKCVISGDDILQELSYCTPSANMPDPRFTPANPLQKIIWSRLSQGPLSVNQILETVKSPPHEILAELTAMEIAGNLRRLANEVYDKAS